MSETTVVDARLDKLEQDNRRLKLATGALLLVWRRRLWSVP